MSKTLFYRSYGTGDPVIILHGLFGMSDNWASFAKLLSAEYRVITPDLRNHGQSFHSSAHNYPIMAEDVLELLDLLELTSAHVIGHSMGGKVAMTMAINAPYRLKSLISVDMAPKSYPGGHQEIIRAIQEAPIEQTKSRKEVKTFLMDRLHSPTIVQFLLKNLSRNKDSMLFEWKFNISALAMHYSDILKEILPATHTFQKKTTFVRGSESNYIQLEDMDDILKYFPLAQLCTIEGAGHWVHADQPKLLLDSVHSHIKDT